jgi:hypothetical protein
MQASSIPGTKFTIPWASGQNGSYVRAIPVTSTDPDAASLTLGWPVSTFTPLASGGAPPDGRDANGIFQELTAWDRWYQAGGPIGYDATFASSIGGYPQGATLIAASGTHFWLSTADNNTTDPDTGGAGWTNLSALGGVLTGSIGAAGFAPNPVFSGTATAGGFSSAGTVYAALLETTQAGYLNIGTGASNIGGTLTVNGNIVTNGEVYAVTGLYTGATGNLGVGTGASSFGGTVNFPGVSIANANISSTGTVAAVDVTFSTELSGPAFSVVNGNVNATSGTVTAVDLTATNTVTANVGSFGTEITCSNTYFPVLCNSYTGILNIAASAYNPLYCASSPGAPNAATIMSQFQGVMLSTGGTMSFPLYGAAGGFIIKFGQVDTGYGIGCAFPTAFPNACLGVVISEGAAQNNTWGGGDNPTLHAATVYGPGGFTHWTLYWTGSAWANQAATGTYIAIGY